MFDRKTLNLTAGTNTPARGHWLIYRALFALDVAGSWLLIRNFPNEDQISASGFSFFPYHILSLAFLGTAVTFPSRVERPRSFSISSRAGDIDVKEGLLAGRL